MESIITTPTLGHNKGPRLEDVVAPRPRPRPALRGARKIAEFFSEKFDEPITEGQIWHWKRTNRYRFHKVGRDIVLYPDEVE
jgi:hypothetical protein